MLCSLVRSCLSTRWFARWRWWMLCAALRGALAGGGETQVLPPPQRLPHSKATAAGEPAGLPAWARSATAWRLSWKGLFVALKGVEQANTAPACWLARNHNNNVQLERGVVGAESTAFARQPLNNSWCNTNHPCAHLSEHGVGKRHPPGPGYCRVQNVSPHLGMSERKCRGLGSWRPVQGSPSV